MKNIEAMKSKKSESRNKSKILSDLQEVNSILEKLEKFTGGNESKEDDKTQQAEQTTDEESKSLDKELEELQKELKPEKLTSTPISNNLLDIIIEELESLLIDQLKNATLRSLNGIVNDQMKLSLKIIIDQKKEISDLLKYYKTIKMMNMLEVTNMSSESTMMIPYLMGKK